MRDHEASNRFDVLIVGSGAAGLTLALSLPSHLRVAVMAKAVLTEASFASFGAPELASMNDKTRGRMFRRQLLPAKMP